MQKNKLFSRNSELLRIFNPSEIIKKEKEAERKRDLQDLARKKRELEELKKQNAKPQSFMSRMKRGTEVLGDIVGETVIDPIFGGGKYR